jgi:hypothetical protein
MVGCQSAQQMAPQEPGSTRQDYSHLLSPRTDSVWPAGIEGMFMSGYLISRRLPEANQTVPLPQWSIPEYVGLP